MKVIIKTKSNYKNLNGKVFSVYETCGNRVSIQIKDEYGRTLTTDFNKSEVIFVDEKKEK